MAIRRFVVVGLGSFGSGLVETLGSLGHEVIAIDIDQTKVEAMEPHATRAAVADGTDVETLDRLGADGADAGIVSVGTDMAASVLALMALHDLEIREIYAKAISDDHATILDRLGATEVIRPEQESAYRLAVRLSQRLLDYMPIAPGYSMEQIPTPDAFIGKTLLDLRLPQRLGIGIVAIHDLLTGKLHVVPPADYRLKDSDTLWVIGSNEALAELTG